MGRARDGWIVGAVSVLAVAAGCDAGSSADFGPSRPAGQTSAGASAAGGKASAGATTSGTAGAALEGGSQGHGGTAGDGGSAADGGNANPGGSLGGASEGGAAGEDASAGEPGVAGESSGGEAGQAGAGGESGCREGSLSWRLRASRVVFMVDRSGTMFALNGEPWNAVREAALPVLDAYADSSQLGFMAVTGEADSCPLLEEVAPAADSYASIAATYEALAKPTKGESPFMLALTRAAELLDAPSFVGEKYVLMVIDGDPDYCNDSNPLCPIDSVVARIQSLRERGITTLVAGLPLLGAGHAAAARHAAALQSYANAGVGLPVAAVGDTVANIYFQCHSGSAAVLGWPAELAATGKMAQEALGSYSANAGSAPVTLLEPNDASAMASAFESLLGRTKSCVFDVEGGSIDAATASSGVVSLAGSLVAHDEANGWRMNTPHELELVGTACTAWQSPDAGSLTLDFPCSAVTP